jgi:hypothetical protein
MRERLTDHPDRLKEAAAGASRREIPEDYKYNPKKLRHLKHILHNVSVAVGTLTSAFNEFSRFKGPDISPDGRLGGAGYILPLKEIKQAIQGSVYGLSDVADCIADELTNPRWGAEDDSEVKKLIKEKDEAVDQAEQVEDADISPDDVKKSPDEESDEDADQGIKMANDQSKILTAAVRQSLIKFFRN